MNTLLTLFWIALWFSLICWSGIEGDADYLYVAMFWFVIIPFADEYGQMNTALAFISGIVIGMAATVTVFIFMAKQFFKGGNASRDAVNPTKK